MEIEHLILDTNFFVNRLEHAKSKKYYTTPSVINEVKDEISKLFLENFRAAYGLTLIQPDKENFDFVTDSAKRLNQFGQLSRPDLEVIALAVQLSKELGITIKQVEKLDLNSLTIQDSHASESKPINTETDPIEDALSAVTQMSSKTETQAADPFSAQSDSWITKDNLQETFQNADTTLQFNETTSILAVYTEDKGMQNILLYLNIQLINSNNQKISSIKRFALKCSACLQLYLDVQTVLDYPRNLPFLRDFQQFDQVQIARKLLCPNCANQGLMRVSVFIKNGVVTTSKGIKYFDLKGTVYNLADLTKKRFVGCKNPHLLHPELYEEKMIKNAKYVSKERKLEFGDDLMKGVGKAQVEQDVAYFLKKNPNVRPMKQMRNKK